jgi:hypothetical protein
LATLRKLCLHHLVNEGAIDLDCENRITEIYAADFFFFLIEKL